LACKNGHLKVVKYIIETFGIEPNSTALLLAGQNGHLDIFQYFVKRLFLTRVLPCFIIFSFIICNLIEIPTILQYVLIGAWTLLISFCAIYIDVFVFNNNDELLCNALKKASTQMLKSL
jgi:hypothetical protein